MADKRRNIVLLMTDQHRRDTLGCYGSPTCETPEIDGLANTGVRFDWCFTPTAMCTPARTSMLTGTLPFRHGQTGNHELNPQIPAEVSNSVVAFSQPLMEASYNLAHIGKWHIGRDSGPADFGFEGEHYSGWENSYDHPDYLQYLAENRLEKPKLKSEVRTPDTGKLLAGILDQPVETTFEYYLATRAIEKLRDFAREAGSADRPFFVACSWFGPHLPYCLPEAYYRRYTPDDVEVPLSIRETFQGKPSVQRLYSQFWGMDKLSVEELRALIAAYWGYVSLIDEQVGRILREIDRLNIADDTAVIFTADHGEFTGSHRLHSKGPAMYDDIYRIPLIIRVPGGRTGLEDRFTTLTDVMPTILELASVEVGSEIDGRSLLPLVTELQNEPWPAEVVAEFHGLHFQYPQRMIRTPSHKLVISPAGENELYDLEADPDEMLNLYQHPRYRQIRQRLTHRLHTVLCQRGDPFHEWMDAMLDVNED